jgi:type I restriction enzyme S subunit
VDDEFDLTMGESPPGETYNETGQGIPFYQGRADFAFRYLAVRIFCTGPIRLPVPETRLSASALRLAAEPSR